uniref:Putative secreted peptide n=1 Tax=Anopheles braziliensis TaxID=58242 RepID=A0A2M3ZUM0_9DIPT
MSSFICLLTELCFFCLARMILMVLITGLCVFSCCQCEMLAAHDLCKQFGVALILISNLVCVFLLLQSHHRWVNEGRKRVAFVVSWVGNKIFVKEMGSTQKVCGKPWLIITIYLSADCTT